MWIYVVAMSILIVAHFIRTVKNNDGMKWYTITISFCSGFIWTKLLLLVIK